MHLKRDYWSFSKLLLYIQLLIWVPEITSLPSGAPESVCNSMLPLHGGGIEPMSTLSPYAIIPSSRVVGQGQTISVNIAGKIEDLDFGGFMIMARNLDDNSQIVGHFNNTNQNNIKLLNCGGSLNSAATHTSSTPKKFITVEWTAPADFLGTVVFRATVAQTYSTFWVDKTSESVRVVPRDQASTGSGTTTPIWNPTTRTTYVPISQSTSAAPVVQEPIYNGCGVSKTCLGLPDGCVTSQNCQAILSVNVRGQIYEFEMRSNADSVAYVAMGLSEDNKMGQDLVTECVPENGVVNVYSSYTSSSPYSASRDGVPQNTARKVEASYTDGVIHCKVQHEILTTVKGHQFDLVNNRYHLLLAHGSSLKENSVGYHDLGRIPADRSVKLAEVVQLTGASLLLVRLHGAFMISAWIGFTSIGIILARYFKNTWVGSQSCGKDQWFFWHRTCMVLTWLLTMCAFVLIFVEIDGWSAERNPHAILGVITTALCFIQPIGALFRPAPNSEKRPIFNWLHWLCGNLAHILAIVTIFFAVQLTKAQLPKWMDWILVAYVVFHVLVHLIYSIAGWISDRRKSQLNNAFQMGDINGHHGGLRGGMKNERQLDAPLTNLRKCLLGVYIVILLLIVAGLLFIIIVAPVENFIKEVESKINN